MLLVELKMDPLREDQLIEEFAPSDGADFGPTPKFHKFYGNYCGPGNRGGDPIDGIDSACKKHDMCYHKKGRYNCDCDKEFVDELDRLLKGQVTFKQRTAAQLMKSYFKTAVAQAEKKSSKKEAAAELARRKNREVFDAFANA